MRIAVLIAVVIVALIVVVLPAIAGIEVPRDAWIGRVLTTRPVIVLYVRK